jgi:hypothetical protein
LSSTRYTKSLFFGIISSILSSYILVVFQEDYNIKLPRWLIYIIKLILRITPYSKYMLIKNPESEPEHELSTSAWVLIHLVGVFTLGFYLKYHGLLVDP